MAKIQLFFEDQNALMVLLFYNIFNFIVYFSTPLLFALETVGEHIIAELLTQNRRDAVEKLWTKQAAKYTTSNSKYSPSKLAALYAIELLHNKDEKKALQLYEELQTHKDMFYIPGLMTTALSIVEQIKQSCNKRL